MDGGAGGEEPDEASGIEPGAPKGDAVDD